MLFSLRLDQKKPYSFYLCFWGALRCHVRNLTTPRTDADTPILWPPDVKSQLIGKDSDAGKDWGQEEKEVTEDEMVWMALPTQWTWVWEKFGRWWKTGKTGVLQFMGLQRIGLDLVTEEQGCHTGEAMCRCSADSPSKIPDLWMRLSLAPTQAHLLVGLPPSELHWNHGERKELFIWVLPELSIHEIMKYNKMIDILHH